MPSLDHTSPCEVIIGSSGKAMSGDDRRVHVFETCHNLRSKNRRVPINTRHEHETLCSTCERRLLDGEKPDVDTDVFAHLEIDV